MYVYRCLESVVHLNNEGRRNACFKNLLFGQNMRDRVLPSDEGLLKHLNRENITRLYLAREVNSAVEQGKSERI